MVERVAVWVVVAIASAPSVDDGFSTNRAYRVFRNVARRVEWQWYVKARPTTRRSKVVVPRAMRLAERRVGPCQEEIEPGRAGGGRRPEVDSATADSPLTHEVLRVSVSDFHRAASAAVVGGETDSGQLGCRAGRGVEGGIPRTGYPSY